MHSGIPRNGFNPTAFYFNDHQAQSSSTTFVNNKICGLSYIFHDSGKAALIKL